MKLTFSKNVPPVLHKFYQLSFGKLCGRLGITDYKLNVRLEFATHIEGPECVKDLRNRITTGSLTPDNTPLNFKRVKAGLQVRDFVLILNADLSFMRMLAAFSHEMVHVKQFAFGELRALLTRENGKWKPQTAYYSTPVDVTTTPYDELPWEKEAHARMRPLAEWLANELDKDTTVDTAVLDG